jgi:hypothetical protein
MLDAMTRSAWLAQLREQLMSSTLEGRIDSGGMSLRVGNHEWYVTHKVASDREDRGKNGYYWKYRTEGTRLER